MPRGARGGNTLLCRGLGRTLCHGESVEARLCSAGGWAARYAAGSAWREGFALPGAMPIAEAGEVSRGGPIVDCSLRSSSLPGNGSFPSLNGRICLVGYPPGGYATGGGRRGSSNTTFRGCPAAPSTPDFLKGTRVLGPSNPIFRAASRHF